MAVQQPQVAAPLPHRHGRAVTQPLDTAAPALTRLSTDLRLCRIPRHHAGFVPTVGILLDASILVVYCTWLTRETMCLSVGPHQSHQDS